MSLFYFCDSYYCYEPKCNALLDHVCGVGLTHGCLVQEYYTSEHRKTLNAYHCHMFNNELPWCVKRHGPRHCNRQNWDRRARFLCKLRSMARVYNITWQAVIRAYDNMIPFTILQLKPYFTKKARNGRLWEQWLASGSGARKKWLLPGVIRKYISKNPFGALVTVT